MLNITRMCKQCAPGPFSSPRKWAEASNAYMKKSWWGQTSQRSLDMTFTFRLLRCCICTTLRGLWD